MGLSDDLTYSQQLASENRFNSNALDDLNNQLSSVYSSLTDLNALQTNALSRQNDIKNIILFILFLLKPLIYHLDFCFIFCSNFIEFRFDHCLLNI